MDLNLSSLGTVPAACCYMFYVAGHQFYWMSDTGDIVLLVLWFEITHRHTHTGHTRTNRLIHTYKYILTPAVMCTQQLPVLHWMNTLLIQTFLLQRSTMSLKNYSLVEVIYLLIRFHKIKSFLWNTKNTVRNGVNEQNTHSTHIEKGNFRKG